MLAAFTSVAPDYSNARYQAITAASASRVRLGKMRDISQIGEQRLAIAPEARLLLPEEITMFVQGDPRIPGLRRSLMGRITFALNRDALIRPYDAATVQRALRPAREPSDQELLNHPEMITLRNQLAASDDETCMHLAAFLNINQGLSDRLHSYLWQNARDETQVDAQTLIGAGGDVADVDYSREAIMAIDPRRLHGMDFITRLTLVSEVRATGHEEDDAERRLLDEFLCWRGLTEQRRHALDVQPAATVAMDIRTRGAGDPLMSSDALRDMLYGPLPFRVVRAERIAIEINDDEELEVGGAVFDTNGNGVVMDLEHIVTGAHSPIPVDRNTINHDTHVMSVSIDEWDDAYSAWAENGRWVEWDVELPAAQASVAAYQNGAADARVTHMHLADSDITCSQLFQVAMAMFYMRQVREENLRLDNVNHFRAGLARGYGLLHGFIGNSTEVQWVPRHDPGLNTDLQLHDEMIDTVINELMHPLRVNMAFCAAAISFLKSGHHSSAARLDNTVQRLLLAMQDRSEIPQPELAGFLGLAVHYGTHVFDMRVIISYLRHLHVYGAISGAIGRRLYPEGPGNVALVLGFRLLEELDHANFFRLLGRVSDYIDARSAYHQWRETAWMELPYAAYLYGQSRAPDQAMRGRITALFPLLSQIDNLVPHSTMTMAVSFRREVGSAAANSIVGGLQVRAFGRAYVAYLEGMVTENLSRQVIRR